MKKIVLAAMLGIACMSAKAQFGVGGQLNWSKYFSGGPSFVGLGLNASMLAGDFPIRLSVNFGLPKTETSSIYAHSLDNMTEPYQVMVNYEERISLLNFWLDGQRYFGDGDYEDGGVYGLLGIGLTIATVKGEVGTYDTSLYSANVNTDKESVSQFSIRGGIGYDAALNFGNLFGEAGLNLSANQANGQTVGVNLPSFLFVNVGVRHWF